MASGACGHSGLAAPRRHALLLPAPAAPPCLSQRAARRRSHARLACAGAGQHASGLEFGHRPPPRHCWTAGVGARAVSSCLVRCRLLSWLKPIRYDVRVQTSNIDLGAGSYGGDEAGGRREQLDSSGTKSSNEPAKPVSGSRYMQAIAAVLLLCALASAFIVFFKGQPSAVVAALAKSGFTAAFMLIFVSEIGDKDIFHCCTTRDAVSKGIGFTWVNGCSFPDDYRECRDWTDLSVCTSTISNNITHRRICSGCAPCIFWFQIN
uniref:GDT1 family protein n=1 Tax=Aegilops tauschii subsp. strangulata TaxID=200361 RepID=A0A453AHJ9_AEGTS